MTYDVRPLRKDPSGWKLLILAALPAAVASAPAIAQAPAGIERLAWLQGCWEVVTPDQVVEEYWMAPRGTTLLGIARTIKGAVLANYEMALIRQTEDRLIFEAHPSNQPTALFYSVDVGPSRIVFENLKHDFPQRIGYERNGRALLAWIEGAQSGKMRRFEFPYTRASCGPA